MICSSVCLLRFIVWSFRKARLQFTPDQFEGATSGLMHRSKKHPNCFESPATIRIPNPRLLLRSKRAGKPMPSSHRYENSIFGLSGQAYPL
jgi:hypothetical protein